VSSDPGGGGAGTAVRLAPVQGRALDGTTYRLPEELPADLTLAVLAFAQRQQPDVDRWIELAVGLGITASPYGSPEALRSVVIEIPVLGRRYLVARRIIDGGMSAGIGDPVALARTITVYTDAAGYARRCGLPTRDEVSALLCRRDGTVAFHAVGPPTAAHRAALGRTLASLR
jgi:hypothetical protein